MKYAKRIGWFVAVPFMPVIIPFYVAWRTIDTFGQVAEQVSKGLFKRVGNL